MSYRVAINGFGRIGRDYLRCVLERGLLGRGIDVVGINRSLCDLTCQLSVPVTATEVNEVFLTASRRRLDGILRYTTKPIVSRDLVGDPASCVLDASLTQAHGTLVKVLGWYDNEWGYTNRLVDLSLLFAEQPA